LRRKRSLSASQGRKPKDSGTDGQDTGLSTLKAIVAFLGQLGGKANELNSTGGKAWMHVARKKGEINPKNFGEVSKVRSGGNVETGKTIAFEYFFQAREKRGGTV